MYRPPSKRVQIIQRVAIYTTMSVAVTTLVAVLVFFMLGYQINRADGRIEQGGLVQFDSRPSGADIMIDGKNLGSRTASRKTMTSGQHFITMQRTGYETWQKSVDVVPGSVLWLTYARMIPQELAPATVSSFTSLAGTLVSPNSEAMAIKEDASTPTIQLADLRNDEVKLTKLDIPADSYTAPAADKTETFSLEKWNSSSRYLLVKHIYDDSKIEWLVVDTDNAAQTKNITTLLGVEASQIIFSPNNGAHVYALVDGAIRKIDLGAVTLSGPLVSNVAEFSIYNNDTVLYDTRPDASTGMRSVGYLDEGANKARILRSYNDDGTLPVHLAVGKYFDDHFVAISYGHMVEVMKGSLSKSDASTASAFTSVATIALSSDVQFLSIVTNGRFVIAQEAGSYTVHDIELKKTTTTALAGDAPAAPTELRWLDPYTVWSDRSGKIRLYEFDGANQHDIMPVAAGFSATYSPNGKYLYGISQSADSKYHLTRVRMILP
ncbi:MAG TPA: PEGA domain-containing protein [Candidatus Saccharimonadales bacterium]